MRQSVLAIGDADALSSRFIAEALAAIGQEERFDKVQAELRVYLYALTGPA